MIFIHAFYLLIMLSNAKIIILSRAVCLSSGDKSSLRLYGESDIDTRQVASLFKKFATVKIPNASISLANRFIFLGTLSSRWDILSYTSNISDV